MHGTWPCMGGTQPCVTLYRISFKKVCLLLFGIIISNLKRTNTKKEQKEFLFDHLSSVWQLRCSVFGGVERRNLVRRRLLCIIDLLHIEVSRTIFIPLVQCFYVGWRIIPTVELLLNKYGWYATWIDGMKKIFMLILT